MRIVSVVGTRPQLIKAAALGPALRDRHAEVWSHDPLLSAAEVEALGARPYRWGEAGPFRAVITQTGDPAFRELDPAWFPVLAVVYDGRNSLRELALPADVAYAGVGVQASTRQRVSA